MDKKVENTAIKAENSEFARTAVRKPWIRGNRRLKNQATNTKIIWDHQVFDEQSIQKSGGTWGPQKSKGCKRKQFGEEAKINKNSRPIHQTLHFYWGPKKKEEEDCSSTRTVEDDSKE